MVKICGIGACVMDTLVTLAAFPAEDTKTRALSSKVSGGGPVATGLVAARKLGVEAAYVGVLSTDAGGAFLLEDFQKYGVDTACVETVAGRRSFTSCIWLSEKDATRTCVFDRGDLPPLHLNEAQKRLIASSEILLIDGNELEAAEEACRVARENGVKVLYDCGGLYPGVERLLKLTDVMIPSREFALGHTGCATVEEAAAALFEKYRPEVVVITCGKEGGLLFDGEKTERYPAFPVEAVDTNGAGDVFHGAFAAAVTKGRSYRDCCLFASAVSAVKCTGTGARESTPDEKTALAFLKSRGVTL